MPKLNGLNRRKILVFSVWIAAIGITGTATSSETNIRIDPRISAAMARDLNLSQEQFSRYMQKQESAHDQFAQAQRQFGENFAGGWFERDANGEYRYIVATTGDAKQVQIPGAEVRRVRYSLRQLEGAVSSLNKLVPQAAQSGGLKGIQSWSIDLARNRVVVSMSSGGMIGAVDFVAMSGANVDLLRFELIPGTVMPMSGSFNIFGGIRFNSCSIGFPVVRASDGTKGFATAGHCGVQGTPVSRMGVQVGWMQGSSFPGNDFAWANVRSSDVLYGLVDQYNGSASVVSGSATADVGAPVCRSGYTTGWRCGTITGIGVTVPYGNGSATVFNLRQSNACAGEGDSGGSWITGNQAQGVTSGGNMDQNAPRPWVNCNFPESQRRTYYQRLNPILSAYGLNLVVY